VGETPISEALPWELPLAYSQTEHQPTLAESRRRVTKSYLGGGQNSPKMSIVRGAAKVENRGVLQFVERASGRQKIYAPQRADEFWLRPPKSRDYLFALRLYLDGAERHLRKIGRWNRPRATVRFRQGYKQGQVQVICVGDKDIGWIQVAEFADRLHLRQLHLVAPFRGRGVGTRLIEDLLQRAAALKKPVTLDVIHGNPARSLYLRLGFAQQGQDADKIQMIWRPRAVGAQRAAAGEHATERPAATRSSGPRLARDFPFSARAGSPR
jgi:GNAT superfamily N-acetyltransferase